MDGKCVRIRFDIIVAMISEDPKLRKMLWAYLNDVRRSGFWVANSPPSQC